MEFHSEKEREILVVEDNDADARLIEHQLRSSRRSFFTTPTLSFAETFEEAVEQLRSEQFDLVLLDLGLPETSGLETLECMTETIETAETIDELPIIVLTGLKDEKLALQAIQRGAQDYLMKGNIDEDTLDRAIRYGLERHRQEQRLKRQNQQLEEFTRAVTHDIRSPLEVAVGHLQVLKEECDHESVDELELTLRRLNEMAEDLLTLIKQGRNVEETEPVEISAVAHTVWNVVDTGEATLCVEQSKRIFADHNRLSHIFENLFTNAVEHGGEDITVWIGLLDDGFYVEDSGSGIEPDRRDVIFEAGYTDEESGLGYGLNVVENMSRAHGWEIQVTDGRVGGARFEITGVTPAETQNGE